jgi:TonB family protein
LPAFRKAGHANLKIRFVIGTDGRLHKMAVVNSAGHAADSNAVNALRQWRYTPATCNGVPMEAEGTVEFPGNN